MAATCMLSALIIGKSSNLAYLTYVLGKNNEVTVCHLEDHGSFPDTWLLFPVNRDSPVRFAPQRVLTSLESLQQDLSERNKPFDYVFFGFEFMPALRLHKTMLASVVGESTLIMVDIIDDPWFFGEVVDILRGTPAAIMSIVSEIDCRAVSDSGTSFQLLTDKELDITVVRQEISDRRGKVTVEGFNLREPSLLKFLQLQHQYNMFHQRQFSIKIAAPEDTEKTTRSIWRKLICNASFYTCLIAFGNPDIAEIVKDPSMQPLVSGIFQEVLTIATKLDVKQVPMPHTKNGCKLFKHLLLMEGISKVKKLVMAFHEGMLPEFIADNKSFYDFSRGLPVLNSDLLAKLLMVAGECEIPVPFIRSTHTVLNILLHILNDESQLFQPKPLGKSMTVLDMVGPVPPNKNMMNFPPFHPLPKPAVPIQTSSNCLSVPVFMASMGEDEDSSHSGDSVDPELQKLVAGTEKFTFGDIKTPPVPPKLHPLPRPAQASIPSPSRPL